MKSVNIVLCLTLLFGVVQCQQEEFASECPEPNGFFADAVQCDKYYACHDGVLTEKLCIDGMVFDDVNPRVEKCDFPFHIKCTERPERQVAKPSKNCPRENGYFPHPDKTNCNQFFYCHGGTGNQITCPESLVFSLKTGTCGWPDQAERADCTSQDVSNFTCPKVSFDIAVAHPRYSDPADCQYFYVCINGETPRRNGCKFGEVFNPKTTACDSPVNVPDCKDYYKEYFEDYFGNVGDGSSIPSADVLAAAIGSGFALPDKPRRVKISPQAGGVRQRRPTADDASALADTPVEEEVAAPPKTRRPQAQSNKAPVTRRRPLRNRASAKTTTTTTTPAPVTDAAYDDYYYDYPEEGTAADAPADAPATPSRGGKPQPPAKQA